MVMEERSDYVDFDAALNFYGLTRADLLCLIDSIVYARLLEPGPDGQLRWEVHRESLKDALDIEQIKREQGATSPTLRALEMQATANRIRLALADGQLVTPQQMTVLRAQEKAGLDYERRFGRPPATPGEVLSGVAAADAGRQMMPTLLVGFLLTVVIVIIIMLWRAGVFG